MDQAEARRVLGVDDTADAPAIRSAFRAFVFARHPDRTGATGEEAAEAIAAYRVLQAVEPDATRPDGAAAPPIEVTLVDADTLAVAAGAEETFLLLLDAAHRIGEVTYVDASAGLLESIITFDEGTVASLVVTMQGRANGTTEAFCTIEALGAGPPPPLEAAVSALIEALRSS